MCRRLEQSSILSTPPPKVGPLEQGLYPQAKRFKIGNPLHSVKFLRKVSAFLRKALVHEKRRFSYLTVEADSSSHVVSVDVHAASPLVHLVVVVTVKRVTVTVTR